jgi:copper chaperone
MSDEGRRMATKTYSVPEIHCGHCEAAVKRELHSVSGVETVEVDLETKLVTVSGDRLDDAALVAAIDEAGYEAELTAAG